MIYGKGKPKMKKNDIAESLATLHTHTHTHTGSLGDYLEYDKIDIKTHKLYMSFCNFAKRYIWGECVFFVRNKMLLSLYAWELICGFVCLILVEPRFASKHKEIVGDVVIVSAKIDGC